MGKQNDGEVKNFVEVLKDIVKQELDTRDSTAIAVVESVNDDNTLNLYILPDRQSIVRNIINQCRYNFKAGDTALLYLIDNRLSNSFVIAKYNPSGSTDSIATQYSDTNVLRIITKALANGGKINNSIREIFKEELQSSYKVGDIYLSTNPTSPAALFGGRWESIPANNVLEIVSSDDIADDTIDAALPNITGGSADTTKYWYGRIPGAQYSGQSEELGAITYITGTTSYGVYTGSGGYQSAFTFDASKSNPIYNNDCNTVQPPAYKIYGWIKRGE